MLKYITIILLMLYVLTLNAEEVLKSTLQVRTTIYANNSTEHPYYICDENDVHISTTINPGHFMRGGRDLCCESAKHPQLRFQNGRCSYVENYIVYPLFDINVTSSTKEVKVYNLTKEQYKKAVGLMFKYSYIFTRFFEDFETINVPRNKNELYKSHK